MPIANTRLIPLKRRKITLPPLNDKLLTRESLVSQLNDCLERRLTLIAAPPGSGKTELVQLWRAQHPKLALAWYNLDSTDNQLAEFSRYLSQAIADATGCQELSNPISHTDDLESLIDFFHAQQPKLVICLDNLHELSCPKLLAALEKCITDPFSSVHWLLLSQQRPKLNLTELQLKDELIELGSGELNFTHNEITELVQARDQSIERVASIFESTQGWIAGVNLSLATQTVDTPAPSHPSQKTIKLFQHIAINQLPQNVFELIQSAAICNPINIDLADHIGNRTDSREAINYLIHNCLFIQPLDQQDNWFHIHPLFFVALKKELLTATDQAVYQRHSRAAEWLIEHQIYDTGLEHLQHSKDSARFDHYLTAISEEWLLNGNLEEINRWCALVDSDRLFGNAKLFLQYLLSLTLSFHVSEATQLLKTYDQIRSASSDDLSVARQLLSVFTLNPQLTNAEDNINSRQQLLMKADKTPLENFVLGTLTNLTSLHSYLSFELSQAKALANEGKRYHRLANSIHGESYSEYLDSAAQFNMGLNNTELAQQLETFAKAKHLQQSQPCYILMSVSIAPLYYELNQHQKSLEYCQSIAGNISTGTHLEVAIFYHLTYAKLLYREQKFDQADHLLGNMLNHASSSYSPRAITMVAFERLRQAMLEKDTSRASLLHDNFIKDRALSEPESSAEQAPNSNNHSDLQNWGLNRLVEVIYHFTNNSFSEAQTILTQVSSTLSLGENKYIAAIVSALMISINWKNSQQQQALNQLSQLIEALNQQGYYCLLRDYIVDLDSMMTELGNQLPKFLQPDFSAELYLRHPNKQKIQQNHSNVAPLLEPLTKRELVLLIDIASGLSNQEISDKRFVAISTVKWHLKNIYAKLDAKHRAQAIARARELGLID